MGLIHGGAYFRNFAVCLHGGGKKMECPILPKAQTQKYPYWMELHFRLLWD